MKVLFSNSGPHKKGRETFAPRPLNVITIKKPWVLRKWPHGFGYLIILSAQPGGLISLLELSHHQLPNKVRSIFFFLRFMIVYLISVKKNVKKKISQSKKFLDKE